MGYYISNMIGIKINSGTKFSDIPDMKERIKKIVLKLRAAGAEYDPDLGDNDGDVSHCMSGMLESHKGTYVVIAGVYNYWGFDSVSVFAKELSKEFETGVMLMSWDMENDTIKTNVFAEGIPLNARNATVQDWL